MLRAISILAFGSASPSIPVTRSPPLPPARARVPVRVGTVPGSAHWDGIADLAGSGSGTMLAPWGEEPKLAGIAVVTTRPFPAEWWRRPRTIPAEESPFIGRSGAWSDDHENVATLGRSGEPPPRPRSATPQGESQRTKRRGAPRRVMGGQHRRGRLARVCLVLAGALISFIVVDAALGNGRR